MAEQLFDEIVDCIGGQGPLGFGGQLFIEQLGYGARVEAHPPLAEVEDVVEQSVEEVFPQLIADPWLGR